MHCRGGRRNLPSRNQGGIEPNDPIRDKRIDERLQIGECLFYIHARTSTRIDGLSQFKLLDE
jgi:hypothetical protein